VPHSRSRDADLVMQTFPAWIRQQAEQRGTRPAMREKDLGIWQTYTWAQVYASMRAIACGLAQRGFARGDRLILLGENRPRLYWSLLACQCLGGIPVPLYHDAIAEEIAFMLQDTEARFAVVENQEQVDKLLELQDQVPLLEHIFYDDPRGMQHYTQEQLIALDTLYREGQQRDQQDSRFLDAEIAQGQVEDIAILTYTSGTTSQPKGVCNTHASFTVAAQRLAAFDGFGDQEEVLAYLPMAWAADYLFSVAMAAVTGLTVNCPESPETILADFREIGPTLYLVSPRFLEAMHTQVMIRMEDAGKFKRRLFHHFMGVSRRYGLAVLDGKPLPLIHRLHYALGRWLVYAPLKNMLGMSRLRVAYTGSAAISPDLFHFYRAIGVNLKQAYGQTETCAYACLQTDGDIRLETVGKPAPGVSVKLADNGEVLLKGPTLFHSYWKRPDATAESFDADGWFRTGDAGVFNADGHLKIVDRAKDVGKLNNGALFAPNYIENKLRFIPYVKEAVAFGNRRDHVCAFLNIDLDAMGDWAERQGIAYAGYADLSQQDAVITLLRTCLETVNAELAQDAAMAAAQVHRFLVLHKELDADDGELTRTRKLRRNVISTRYAQLIDALYDTTRTTQHVETPVKYEDGREGRIAATLRLETVRTFDAPTA